MLCHKISKLSSSGSGTDQCYHWWLVSTCRNIISGELKVSYERKSVQSVGQGSQGNGAKRSTHTQLKKTSVRGACWPQVGLDQPKNWWLRGWMKLYQYYSQPREGVHLKREGALEQIIFWTQNTSRCHGLQSSSGILNSSKPFSVIHRSSRGRLSVGKHLDRDPFLRRVWTSAVAPCIDRCLRNDPAAVRGRNTEEIFKSFLFLTPWMHSTWTWHMTWDLFVLV